MKFSSFFFFLNAFLIYLTVRLRGVSLLPARKIFVLSHFDTINLILSTSSMSLVFKNIALASAHVSHFLYADAFSFFS